MITSSSGILAQDLSKNWMFCFFHCLHSFLLSLGLIGISTLNKNNIFNRTVLIHVKQCLFTYKLENIRKTIIICYTIETSYLYLQNSTWLNYWYWLMLKLRHQMMNSFGYSLNNILTIKSTEINNKPLLK